MSCRSTADLIFTNIMTAKDDLLLNERLAASSRSSPTMTSCDVPGGMGLPAEEAHPPKRQEGPDCMEYFDGDFDVDRFLDSVDMVDYEEHVEDLIAAAAADSDSTTEVEVAVDSGSVANVLRKGDVPASAVTTINETEHDFVDAQGGRIKNHGTCKTIMVDAAGRQIGCRWRVAGVSRPLHSVSCITGPEEGTGDADVLFSNKRCVVVPPGIVEKLMQRLKPITEYRRKGGLYTAKMALSGFGRRGQGQ